ncbi:uncharacterized protein LOC142550208 [Primulina tabacum]|uniref:uncharacterized protein LOC142550208 n=1 Tax=Primulina tabacum TaxID=48773 RepID=UPI003F5A5AA2
MPPKLDIGWEFDKPIGDNRKTIQCKFCEKVVSGGITRLKQHIAHVSGNVESCSKAPKEILLMLQKHDISYFSGLHQQKKTADFILSLLYKVIDEIGEENIVHVVTDSESANKAVDQKFMIKRPHLFWSPCAAHCIDLMLEDIGMMSKVKKFIDKANQITSFIYNNDKIVNLMKIYTNDRELESLVRYCQDLKRLCTSIEWQEYKNTSKRRKDAEKIAAIILDTRFWKTARDICAIMEPLVKFLKLVDQDNKPTLSIIYEAMDRYKLSIKESVKDCQSYWDVIDERWYSQLHQHLHAAAYFLHPMLQYSGTCVFTDEVKRGLKVVVKRLEPDLNAQASKISEV